MEEEATSMEMNPGALPHPERVPTQKLCSPEACWRWRRRSELLLEKGVVESGFPPQSKNRAKWGLEGRPHLTRRVLARPPPWLHGQVAWFGSGPLRMSFVLLESSVMLIFYIIFLN